MDCYKNKTVTNVTGTITFDRNSTVLGECVQRQ